MTATPDTATRSGGPATLKIYNAVFGYREEPVRKFTIGEVRPYAQHDRSVRITFIRPSKRNSTLMELVPDNIRFVTVDVGGKTVYDSRADVPCDMHYWNATNEKFGHNRPGLRRIGGAESSAAHSTSR